MKLGILFILTFNLIMVMPVFSDNKDVSKLLDSMLNDQANEKVIKESDRLRTKEYFLFLLNSMNSSSNADETLHLIVRMITERWDIILNTKDALIWNKLNEFLDMHDKTGQLKYIIQLTLDRVYIKHLITTRNTLNSENINAIKQKAQAIIVYQHQNKNKIYNIDFVYNKLIYDLKRICGKYSEIKSFLLLYEIIKPEKYISSSCL